MVVSCAAVPIGGDMIVLGPAACKRCSAVMRQTPTTPVLLLISVMRAGQSEV